MRLSLLLALACLLLGGGAAIADAAPSPSLAAQGDIPPFSMTQRLDGPHLNNPTEQRVRQ